MAGRCPGCPEHARALASQRDGKVARLRMLLAEAGLEAGAVARLGVTLTTPAALAFREHLDLRWDGVTGRLGLVAAGEVVDMARCELATPALNAWLADVRARPLPIVRASLRLRVGAPGRGVWIDCAHADVKALLDERAWLEATVRDAVVELGPKARRVVIDDAHEGARVRLDAATLSPWSSTWLGARAAPLYTTVRAFSQPGPTPNAALVAEVVAAVAATHARQALELGAGAGNLTLPLLAAGVAVRAVELDGAALARSAAEAGLAARLEVVATSFERAAEVATLARDVEAIVADPPRQGLGRFVDALAALAPSLRPPALVYVSCHPEALARDAARLAAAGYRLAAAAGVDQFPWTPLVEWVARFARPQ